MAWVIESMNPDRREHAVNKIYELFQNHYKKESLWNDSIAELEPITRELIFQQIKLEIERKAEAECHAFGAFEKERFRAKNIPDLVTVEGQCMNCGLYTPSSFWLDKYMDMVQHPNGVIVITCPACKKDGSLEFPILL